MYLDVQPNRRAVKYSKRVLVARVLWGFGKWVFRLSPRPCFGFRRVILRIYGATVGECTNIYSTANIYFPWNLTIGANSSIGEDAMIYNLGPVRIGERSTISQRAHLCAGTHDFTDPTMPLLKPPINIGNDAWICADAFVGPNVTVGDGAIVGARAVAVKDVPAWTIVAGNPAKVLKDRILKSNS